MNLYADLFLTFAKVGVCTFGGGYAMLPILQREVVEKKNWATEEELTDYFAIGQCTPGVIAVNTATFIGQKYRGNLGGTIATLGVVFPSLVIITIIAAFLGIPQVTLCGKVEIEDGWAVCERLLPDRTEKVKVKLPALITVCAEANEPRYATPIGIMKALKKPRYTWNAADLGCEPDMIGIPGSPSSNKRIFEPPKRNTDTKYFEGEPEAIAKAIADVLEAEHII